MGLDIHTFVEKQTPQGWQAVGEENEFWTQRHYELSTILADMAHWRCNATPIATPRGLPPDCSEKVREALDDSILGTASWVSLDELMSYPWDNVIRGYAGEKTAREYCNEFLSTTVPKLILLAAQEKLSLQAVRMVLWFNELYMARDYGI